jgi:hypothetical protein
MEKIHSKVHQPLPQPGEKLELAECEPVLVSPIVYGTRRFFELEIPKLKEERDFEPNLVRREMVKMMNDALILSGMNPTWKVIQAWKQIRAKMPCQSILVDSM